MEKKDKSYVWISLVLVFLFWVPLLNVFFLSLALILSARQAYLVKKAPDQYGGMWAAGIIFLFALNSLYFGIKILLLSF